MHPIQYHLGPCCNLPSLSATCACCLKRFTTRARLLHYLSQCSQSCHDCYIAHGPRLSEVEVEYALVTSASYNKQLRKDFGALGSTPLTALYQFLELLAFYGPVNLRSLLVARCLSPVVHMFFILLLLFSVVIWIVAGSVRSYESRGSAQCIHMCVFGQWGSEAYSLLHCLVTSLFPPFSHFEKLIVQLLFTPTSSRPFLLFHPCLLLSFTCAQCWCSSLIPPDFFAVFHYFLYCCLPILQHSICSCTAKVCFFFIPPPSSALFHFPLSVIAFFLSMHSEGVLSFSTTCQFCV